METELNTPPESQEKRSFIREALAYVGELTRVVVISLAIILPVRYFLVQPFYVKGVSMEPNFYDHEYLVIDEISFRFREPKRGEIVVFRYPRDPSQFFIKRVVGLPGETVEIRNSRVKITSDAYPDGLVLDEAYLDPDVRIWVETEVTLGAEEYFILGDNRDSSLDSRQFGPISREVIVGRVWLRGWPLDRITRFMVPVYEISSTL